MAEQQYGERGGNLPGLRLDAPPAIGAHADRQPFEPFSTSSSPQHIRFSPAYLESSSGVNSAVQSLTSDSTPDSKLELSLEDAAARKGMLENPIFPTLRNDAGDARLDSPEEMQKNDPLATQIWRLYSKARTQLPNAERMENLTWRMMAMNMRRAEQERNKGYGKRHVTASPSTC
jgi:GATA-binding protein